MQDERSELLSVTVVQRIGVVILDRELSRFRNERRRYCSRSGECAYLQLTGEARVEATGFGARKKVRLH